MNRQPNVWFSEKPSFSLLFFWQVLTWLALSPGTQLVWCGSFVFPRTISEVSTHSVPVWCLTRTNSKADSFSKLYTVQIKETLINSECLKPLNLSKCADNSNNVTFLYHYPLPMHSTTVLYQCTVALHSTTFSFIFMFHLNSHLYHHICLHLHLDLH